MGGHRTELGLNWDRVGGQCALQNGARNGPKSTQNRAEMGPESLPGPLWGHVGGRSAPKAPKLSEKVAKVARKSGQEFQRVPQETPKRSPKSKNTGKWPWQGRHEKGRNLGGRSFFVFFGLGPFRAPFLSISGAPGGAFGHHFEYQNVFFFAQTTDVEKSTLFACSFHVF